LPGGAINGSATIDLLKKKEIRFDSLEIYLLVRVKFIDMLEKTKF